MERGDLEFGEQEGLDPSRAEQRANRVLAEMHRVAVVGASDNPLRKSSRVLEFLERQGVEVIRLPNASGLAHLEPIPDTAVLFCAPDELPAVAADVSGTAVRAVWCQEGLIDPGIARALEDAGKVVVMDRCVMRDYRRQLLGEEVESWFPI